MDRVNAAFAIIVYCLSAALVTPTLSAVGSATADAAASAALASVADATNATSAANATQSATMAESANATSIHPVSASSSDKDGFCRNLTELEYHLTRGLEAENNSTYGGVYECTCGNPDEEGDGHGNKLFTVDCVINVMDDGKYGDGTFLRSEQMVFKLQEYKLSTTS